MARTDAWKWRLQDLPPAGNSQRSQSKMRTANAAKPAERAGAVETLRVRCTPSAIGTNQCARVPSDARNSVEPIRRRTARAGYVFSRVESRRTHDQQTERAHELSGELSNYVPKRVELSSTTRMEP